MRESSVVAGGVAGDDAEQPGGGLGVFEEVARLRHGEKRHECFLCGVERVGVVETLAACDADEHLAVFANELRDPSKKAGCGWGFHRGLSALHTRDV